MEDETEARLYPPLRASWSRIGEQAEVHLTGFNMKRVLFGCIALKSGARVTLLRERQKAPDFCKYLSKVRNHFRKYPLAMMLDENSSHIAKESREKAKELQIKLIFLPKRAPKLNAMDHLWRHGKQEICANYQEDIETRTRKMVSYVNRLPAQQARRKAGILSKKFWLKPFVK